MTKTPNIDSCTMAGVDEQIAAPGMKLENVVVSRHLKVVVTSDARQC